MVKRGLTVAVPMIIVLAVTLTGCGASWYKASGMEWNTIYNVTYEGPEELADSIVPTLEAVGRSVSVFDKTSVVSKVNAGERVSTDSLFRHIYNISRRVNQESSGYFDPTVEPLIEVWGFGKNRTPSADTAKVAEMLSYVGITHTRLEGEWLVKDDKRTLFNFSAIAKGYGCDAVAAMLERNGVKNYLVEIGGEVRTGGYSRKGKWSVGVETPKEGDQEIELIVELTGEGLATSGNYRNYHGEGDKKFGHTINPKTGRPEQTEVVSATVIGKTAAESDAYATALMAMGKDRGLAMARELKLPVMLILADGKIVKNSWFERYVKK